MNQHYCFISGCNEDNNKEIALYTGMKEKSSSKNKPNRKKRFKGNCRDCRKYGYIVKKLLG